MKLIAHIGAPKTATTHIQAILRENSRRIEEAGYRYLGPGNIRKTEHWKRIFAYYRGKASLDDLAHIGELLPKADQILFSEEGITHDLMPRGPAEGGFGNVEQSANVLEMLGADDLHVVLAIRRQDHFLASTYAHYVHRRALSLSADDWFRRVVDPTLLSWASVIDVFERRFGKENLTIIPFDRAKNDFAGYIAWVIAATGIDSSGWTMRPDASNPSLSEKGIELARAINERAGTEHRRRRQVVNTIIREFPASEFGKFSLNDTAIPGDLARLYDEENRALGARWFPEHADALGFDVGS